MSKQYKGAISKNINMFKKEKINKLRNLKDAKPRNFWKIINSVDKKENSTAPLHELYDYFKTLNEDDYNVDSDLHTNFSQSNVHNTNMTINKPFTESEIIAAVKNLKNNKSNGIDNILNEHLKMSIHKMLPIYKKLFNIIFDSGLVPESWSIGDILPIYKNKGDPNLPENYRPITLLSCFGKLFTAILNNRLNSYLEENGIISSCQAGFRKGFSTTDNLFIMQSFF